MSVERLLTSAGLPISVEIDAAPLRWVIWGAALLALVAALPFEGHGSVWRADATCGLVRPTAACFVPAAVLAALALGLEACLCGRPGRYISIRVSGPWYRPPIDRRSGCTAPAGALAAAILLLIGAALLSAGTCSTTPLIITLALIVLQVRCRSGCLHAAGRHRLEPPPNSHPRHPALKLSISGASPRGARLQPQRLLGVSLRHDGLSP